MKTIIQTLEKQSKIRTGAVIEIAKKPNPTEALLKLFSLINDEPLRSSQAESIRELTELLSHDNIKGYASTALKEPPRIRKKFGS